jgi:branched-subunit amino acid transport protein AzlD
MNPLDTISSGIKMLLVSLKLQSSNLVQKPQIIMKTTVLGILTIITTLANVTIQILSGGSPDFTAALAAVVAGAGLIQASDAK